jgi:hypothetical protein
MSSMVFKVTFRTNLGHTKSMVRWNYCIFTNVLLIRPCLKLASIDVWFAHHNMCLTMCYNFGALWPNFSATLTCYINLHATYYARRLLLDEWNILWNDCLLPKWTNWCCMFWTLNQRLAIHYHKEDVPKSNTMINLGAYLSGMWLCVDL